MLYRIYIKLISPDFIPGKLLVLGKMIVDLIIFIYRNPSKDSLSFAKLILQVKPKYTMLTNRNLFALFNIVQEVEMMGLTGDIVECGVWNGGSAAIMGVACNKRNPSNLRKIWLFDSFQGLPSPGSRDSQFERMAYFEGWNKGDIDKVKQVFNTVNFSLDNVNIIPGWFNETLQIAEIDSIAILHIDADWYESVKIVLDSLYEKVVPNGFIILNDYYYWQGCKQATNEFFSDRKIDSSIIKSIEEDSVYFQKP